MKIHLSVFIIILFYINTSSALSSEVDIDLKIFTVNSYQEIINQQQDKSFYLLFWSIECAPCLQEMQHISTLSAEIKKQYIFVATDGNEFKQEITAVLKEINLEQANHWVYNSNESEQIISTIDKRWYGETPRQYFFDKGIRRQIKHR